MSVKREVPGGVKSASTWLDPEEFPFTTDEVFQAASLWLAPREARAFADEVTEFKRRQVRDRDAHRLRLQAHPEQRDKLFFFLAGEDRLREPWLLPALSVISEACGERVEEALQRHWSSLPERALADAKRAWVALAIESKSRLEARRATTDSPPPTPPHP